MRPDRFMTPPDSPSGNIVEFGFVVFIKNTKAPTAGSIAITCDSFVPRGMSRNHDCDPLISFRCMKSPFSLPEFGVSGVTVASLWRLNGF